MLTGQALSRPPRAARGGARQDLHKKLEAKISAFHGTEDTILYPSCFDANVSISEGGLVRAEEGTCEQRLSLSTALLGRGG